MQLDRTRSTIVSRTDGEIEGTVAIPTCGFLPGLLILKTSEIAPLMADLAIQYMDAIKEKSDANGDAGPVALDSDES